ncbi:MAG: hypothetical protein JW778_03670 [Candidatus Altiarchaeota archaeon]|nr:hypothetical protein [Candidatus Altiarchaeota archaeon]
MTEEEAKKKSVEDIFKNAFKPTGKVEGDDAKEKSASEIFKDLFMKGKVIGSPSAEEEEALPEEEEEALLEEIEKRLEGRVDEKSVEDIFKNAFKPTGKVEKEETEEKPASDVFKDLFKPISPPMKAGEKKPAPEATPQEKPRVPVVDVIKESHEKGAIDKKTYDQAVQKILRNSIEGGSLVGEFTVVERGGKPEIVLDEGEIEIPPGSKIEVLKKDGEIAIIVKKGSNGGIEGNIGELEGLIDGGNQGVKRRSGEIGKIGGVEQMDWLEEYEEEESGIMGEVKDEVELADLKKEFKLKKREEEKEEELVEEEEKEPGILDRILKRVKKTTEESHSNKLKRLSLENLSRMKEIEDERKAIVGIAYVLKEFLEIKYEISQELTYTELIRELRTREMNNELRNRLITFFKKTALMVYANAPKIDSFSKVYSLAERTIKELS